MFDIILKCTTKACHRVKGLGEIMVESKHRPKHRDAIATDHKTLSETG